MILGIVITVLYLLLLVRFALKKNKLFVKAHIPLAIVFFITVAAHFATTLPIWGSRSIYVVVTGILIVLYALFSMVTGLQIKKNGLRSLYAHRILALAGLLCIAVHIIFSIRGLNEYQKQAEAILIEQIEITNIPNGTYIGEYDITYIYAKVAVTVQSGVIIKIDILEHKNEHGQAAESITESIVTQQHLDVDSVSGATNSSMVIKKAVQNALSITG